MNEQQNFYFLLSKFLLLLSLAFRVAAVDTVVFRFASVLFIGRNATLSLAVAGVLSIATLGGAEQSAPPTISAKAKCSRLNAKVQVLPKPQCSSGTSQSRPFPARPMKVREVRGNNQTGTARPAPDGARKSAKLPSCRPASTSAFNLQLSTLNSQLYFALGEIESGGNDRAIGAVGEVSRYQIRPAVWKRFASPGLVPVREADARVVVARILSYRVRSFTDRAHRPPTAAEIYVLWNAPAVLESRKQKAESRNKNIPTVVAERAERFANLFNA
jgi:hypothetical protein